MERGAFPRRSSSVSGGERIDLGDGCVATVYPSLHSCVWTHREAPQSDDVCIGDLDIPHQKRLEGLGELLGRVRTLAPRRTNFSARRAKARAATAVRSCFSLKRRAARYSASRTQQARLTLSRCCCASSSDALSRGPRGGSTELRSAHADGPGPAAPHSHGRRVSG